MLKSISFSQRWQKQVAVGRGKFATFSIVGAFWVAGTVVAQDAVTPRKAAENEESTSASSVKTSHSAETSAASQTATEPSIVVKGDELPSAYGAPGAFSRSRFSTITNAYVLPPGSVFSALIYEGDAFREGKPDHLFTQEIELGLPYRFGLAVENSVERFSGGTEDSSFSIEGRYAFADWNKIPLNPTIFAEYKFGIGKILHEEGPPPPPEEAEAAAEEGPPAKPDAYEFRLLLAQDFGDNVEWAFNAFFEKENTGDRGREWGFAQSVQVPLLLEHEGLKAGLEMQYTNFTVKDTRGSPIHRFVIGPAISWKPTANCRLDISPLFGVTDDSPQVQTFVVLSYVFGGVGEPKGAEAPASTRNR